VTGPPPSALEGAPSDRRLEGAPSDRRLDVEASDRRLHVALLCPYSLSRFGGVQTQVLALARALEGRGHVVSVLAPTDDSTSGPLGPSVVAAGRLISLGGSTAVPANGSVAPLALSPVASWKALHFLRRSGADVVHFHEPLAPGPGYGCLLGAPQAKVGTFHRSGASLAYRVLAPVARVAARQLDVRCAVSRAAEETATSALGGSMEIVPNGVDVDQFAGVDPHPTEGPTILFLGRHEARKGLGVLLEAFDRHRARAIVRGAPGGAAVPVTLWIAGSGPDTATLRLRYPPGSGIEWLGAVDDREKASRLLGAHVLCVPSLAGESFGVVLVEAMMARTAVLASSVSGYADVVGHHATLVPPGDPVALASALDRLVVEASQASGRCAPPALDAAARHVEGFGMDVVADRYVELYRQALLRSARRGT